MSDAHVDLTPRQPDELTPVGVKMCIGALDFLVAIALISLWGPRPTTAQTPACRKQIDGDRTHLVLGVGWGPVFFSRCWLVDH